MTSTRTRTKTEHHVKKKRKHQPKVRASPKKKKTDLSADDIKMEINHAWLASSRPATRFCKMRKWLGLLQLPPHELDGGGRTSGLSNELRPPVHEGCETRTTSPVTGSVNDACVVTLLRVPVDVIVALFTGSGAAGGSTGKGLTTPWEGGGADKWRPVAESGGDTSPGLGRRRRRSAEEMELEWARDLRLLAVKPRECAEFELDTGAEPDALGAERGLTCDRIECSDPCSETVVSRGYTIVEG
jgi:hypothetical protein